MNERRNTTCPSMSYRAIHKRVRKNKPKSTVCELCRREKTFLDIANISGSYLDDPTDYLWLCRRCHIWYDNLAEYSHHIQVAKKRKLAVGKPNRTSGVTGVSLKSTLGVKKWRAYITVNRKQISGGLYPSKELAVKARRQLEKKYFIGTI